MKNPLAGSPLTGKPSKPKTDKEQAKTDKENTKIVRKSRIESKVNIEGILEKVLNVPITMPVGELLAVHV